LTAFLRAELILTPFLFRKIILSEINEVKIKKLKKGKISNLFMSVKLSLKVKKIRKIFLKD
jgi:hypothetical protein